MSVNDFAGAREAGEGAELLGIEPLEEHARRLAALLTPERRRRQPVRQLRDVREHERRLRQLYTALEDDARAGEPTSPAAEWLLDNFHIVSARHRDIRTTCRPRSSGGFRRIAADEFAGLPRIYAHGARADPLQRRPARRAAPAPLRHGVPVGHAAHDRRALGVAERAQARARRAPARAGGGPGGEPCPAPRGRPARRARSRPRQGAPPRLARPSSTRRS